MLHRVGMQVPPTDTECWCMPVFAKGAAEAAEKYGRRVVLATTQETELASFKLATGTVGFHVGKKVSLRRKQIA